jgi:hypothetical protein
MTTNDEPNADAFWSDHARRGRGRRTERTREHTAITKGMRRPDTGAVTSVGRHDPTPPIGPGMFDDIPDDPFADDFGLGTYAGLSGVPAGAEQPVVDHELELEPRRRRGGGTVDPLLVRIGVIVVAAVIAVPIVGAFGGQRGADDAADQVTSEEDSSTTASTQPRRKKRATTTSSAVVPKSATNDRSEPAAFAGAGAGAAGPLADSPMGPAPDARPDTDDAAPTPVPATTGTTSPPCGSEYEVVAGDYWLRLADASGSDLDDLLAVNGATVDTPLYPGLEICLPTGATTPAPPPTTPAPTTQPRTTEPPTTEPPATDPPTTEPPTTEPPTTEPPTTEPPTTDPPTTDPPTTDPPTTSPPPTGSVPDIIRSVFPEHLEEHALEIARRESNFVPTARNYCCYGLFQIYYEVHAGWLSSVGVNSAEDLFDPYLNSRAAYVLYQRSGGWGPWGG